MTGQKVWDRFYYKTYSIPFITWNAKEGQNLKRIVSTLKTFWRVKEEIELTEEQEIKALDHFLGTINDEFVLNSLSPSMVYSQMNRLLIDAYAKPLYKGKGERIRSKVVTKSIDQIAQENSIKDGYNRLRNNDK
jgi:hypothetical protein